MRVRFRVCGFVSWLALVFCLTSANLAVAASDTSNKPSAGVTRTYYIAAEEIDWNYTPDGKDMMM